MEPIYAFHAINNIFLSSNIRESGCCLATKIEGDQIKCKKKEKPMEIYWWDIRIVFDEGNVAANALTIL